MEPKTDEQLFDEANEKIKEGFIAKKAEKLDEAESAYRKALDNLNACQL